MWFQKEDGHFEVVENTIQWRVKTLIAGRLRDVLF